MIYILAVHPSEVDDVMPWLGEHYRRAFTRGGRLKAEDFLKHIRKGTADLWAVMDDRGRPLCACVTSTPTLESGEKVCRLVAVGGVEREKWVAFLHLFMMTYREVMGCRKFIGSGRKGWARVLGLKPVSQNPDGTWFYEDVLDVR